MWFVYFRNGDDKTVNDKYFRNRIERSSLSSLGLDLLETQENLVSLKYQVETLRIKASIYKAYFFRNSALAEKLEKQNSENTYALVGEFDGFCHSSVRSRAVFRTLEDMFCEGLITESEYMECNCT